MQDMLREAATTHGKPNTLLMTQEELVDFALRCASVADHKRIQGTDGTTNNLAPQIRMLLAKLYFYAATAIDNYGTSAELSQSVGEYYWHAVALRPEDSAPAITLFQHLNRHMDIPQSCSVGPSNHPEGPSGFWKEVVGLPLQLVGS